MLRKKVMFLSLFAGILSGDAFSMLQLPNRAFSQLGASFTRSLVNVVGVVGRTTETPANGTVQLLNNNFIYTLMRMQDNIKTCDPEQLQSYEEGIKGYVELHLKNGEQEAEESPQSEVGFRLITIFNKFRPDILKITDFGEC